MSVKQNKKQRRGIRKYGKNLTQTTVARSAPDIEKADRSNTPTNNVTRWKRSSAALELGAVLLAAVDAACGIDDEGHIFPDVKNVIRVVPIEISPAEAQLGLAFLEKLGFVARWTCCGKEIYGKLLY
jgi:hypothetical protein